MTDDDEQTIQALRSAMAVQVRGHHLNPQIAARVGGQLESQAGSTRRRPSRYGAMAAGLVGVAAVAVVYAVTRPGGEHRPALVSPATSACNRAVVTSTLPVWARSGFSPDAYVTAHVTGANGEIIGVLFTNPLRSPPGQARNKILWVAKVPGSGPLLIRARREGSAQVVTRQVSGGPGPSIIDVPAPGCWQMTLTWSGHRDTLAVPYAP